MDNDFNLYVSVKLMGSHGNNLPDNLSLVNDIPNITSNKQLFSVKVYIHNYI